MQILKEPELFSWATEQIRKDKEEKVDFFRDAFEILKPWLDIDLYSAIKKKEKKDEEKLLTIAKVDNKDKVETVNAYDMFMKNLGIKPDNK